MQVSRKTDYALRALFCLVEHHGGQPVPIREIARRNDIPKKFLEQIMLELKAQGWVTSSPGTNGGYRLAKEPGRITLGEIVRHFEEMLAPIACVSVKKYERCTQQNVCRFRRVFLDVRNYVTTALDGATLQMVYSGAPVETQEVFGGGINVGAGI